MQDMPVSASIYKIYSAVAIAQEVHDVKKQISHLYNLLSPKASSTNQLVDVTAIGK